MFQLVYNILILLFEVSIDCSRPSGYGLCCNQQDMTASLNNELKSFLDELFGVDGKNLSSIRKKYEEALEKKSKLQEQVSLFSSVNYSR